MRLSILPATLLFGVTAVVACSPESSSVTAPVLNIADTTFAASLGINLATMTKTSDGLYYQDSVAGTGATALSGNQVSVTYTGYLTNGSAFGTNVGGTLLTFSVGEGQVIAGFDEGVLGMKVGGTRKLVIPPSLGYGTIAAGAIPGNSILVFTITLVSIQ
jgi:FKBP-type peptidyl-prolyl cis-trans isomerase FkpA